MSDSNYLNFRRKQCTLIRKPIFAIVTLALAVGFAGLWLVASGDAAQAKNHKGDGGGKAAAKATAQMSSISIVDAANASVASNGHTGWTPIFSQTMKTANNTDLFIDVSMECGLYTLTKNQSQAGDSSTAVAEAEVRVRVRIDDGVDSYAYPGENGVTFCRRSQTLESVFQGLLTNEAGQSCLTTNLTTGVTSIDETCLRPESVKLILDTMTANSFNFIHPDLASGTHTIVVEAQINTQATSDSLTNTGVKVVARDAQDQSTVFLSGDPTMVVSDGSIFRVGDRIIIDDNPKDGDFNLFGEEQLTITGINGNVLTVVRGVNNSPDMDHADDSETLILDAQASASLGHGTMTVEGVRMVKDENMEIQ